MTLTDAITACHRHIDRIQPYLDSRGIGSAAIEHFQLGYCEAGRYAGRLLFPIVVGGKPVGVAGRAVTPEIQPKYLNSPESEIFHKGEVLYGIDDIPQGPDHILVVEGYVDVVSLWQIDVPAVACCGTALTRQHARLMASRNPGLVVLGLDADEGGAAGTQRAALTLMDEGLDVRIVTWSAKDPDEVVRTLGPETITANLGHVQTYLDWVLARSSLFEPKRRAEYVASAIHPIRSLLARATVADVLGDAKLVEEISRQPIHNDA